MRCTKYLRRCKFVVSNVNRDDGFRLRDNRSLYGIEPNATGTDYDYMRPRGHPRGVGHGTHACQYATGEKRCTVKRNVFRDDTNLARVHDIFNDEWLSEYTTHRRFQFALRVT